MWLLGCQGPKHNSKVFVPQLKDNQKIVPVKEDYLLPGPPPGGIIGLRSRCQELISSARTPSGIPPFRPRLEPGQGAFTKGVG